MATHPIFPLAITEQANLLLCPCPGTKGVDLAHSLQDLSYQNSPALLTLMTKAELEANEIHDLGRKAAKFEMQWFHLPIEDDEIPDQAWEDYFQIILPRLKQLLNSGLSLSIHCKGGSGRTGVLAARLMLEMGHDLESSIQQIQALRPNAFSQPNQLAYIQQFA